MAPAERISVEVVHSPAPRTVQRMQVSLDAGATVEDALRATGWFASDPVGLSLGIWGRKTDPTAVVRDQDRVEVYRGLIVDPKEARRQRYRAQGTVRSPSDAGL